MLSVHQTIRTSREWLVVVVPVGAISRDKYLRYLSVIRRQSTVELRENASYFGKNKFANRNWEQDVISINFESWENVHKSDWEELQLNRKIVGIIGVADFGAEDKLDVTYQAFLKGTAPYLEWIDPGASSSSSTPASTPSTGASRSRSASDSSAKVQGKSTGSKQSPTAGSKIPRLCLGFEPRGDQTEIDPSEFKMIPNQDDAHVEFYVKHLLLVDLVSPVLARLGDQYEAVAELLEKAESTLHSSSTMIPFLTTPLDSDTNIEEKGGLGLSTSSKKRRRRAARLRKQQADLALLGGSPIDAVTIYGMTADACKSNSDWEWAATALEGYVAAKVLTLQSLSEEVQKELVDKLNEALGYYRQKKAEMLEIELSLKLARFLVELNRKIEAAELLTNTYLAAGAMSTQEKIRLASAIAVIFQTAGMQRKFSFYMREMAALCSSILPFAKSHQLVSRVAELYGIDASSKIAPSHFHYSPDSGGQVLMSPDNSRSRKQVVLDNGVRWTRLRTAVLTALIHLASQTGDVMQTVKYLIYMLREIIPEEIQLNHEAAASIGASGLESSVYTPSGSSSTLDSLMGTLGIGSGSHVTSSTSTIPTMASLIAGSSADAEYVQMLREKTSLIPPVFLHASDPKNHRSGLGITGNVLPVVDTSVFLKVSKHVVDPLFLFRPKKFTKAGQEAEKEIPIAYTWHGNTSFFTVDMHNPYSIELCIEKLSLRLVPLIVTQVSRGKFDIITDPDINCESQDETGPVCRATLPPKSSLTLRIPVVIPRITNLPVGTQKTVLLLPSHLDYTVFNCHFQERLDSCTQVPDPINLAWAIPRTMRLLKRVPQLRVLEVSHQWNSNADAHLKHIKAKNAEENSNSAAQETASMKTSLDVSAHLFPLASRMSPTNSVIQLDGTSDLADQASPLIQAQLLRGEEYRSVIKLTNEDSHVDIDEINVDILENGVSLQQAANDMAQQGSSPCNISTPHLEATFADMIQIIRKSLPIKPKHTVYLPLRLLADKFAATVAFVFEYRSSACEQDIYRRSQCVFSYTQQNDGLQISNIEMLTSAQQTVDWERLGQLCPSASQLPHSAAGLEAKDAHFICLDISNTSSRSYEVFSTPPFEGAVDPTKIAFSPLRLHTTPPVCPICNKDTVLRRGQTGTILNCVAYPECRFFRENPEPVDNGESLRARTDCENCGFAREPHFGAGGLLWRCSSPDCDSKVILQSDLEKLEWKRLESGACISVAPWSTSRMIIPIHPAVLQREVVEEMRRSLVVPMSIVLGAPKLAKRKVPPVQTLIRASLRWLLRFHWRSSNHYGLVSTDGSADLLSSSSLVEKLLPPPVRVNMRVLKPPQAATEESRVHNQISCNLLATFRVEVERLPITLPQQMLQHPEKNARFTVSIVCNAATLEEQRESSWLPSKMTWIGKNLNLDLPNPIGLRESLAMVPNTAVPTVDVSVLIHAPGQYTFTASAVDSETHQTYWSMPLNIRATSPHSVNV